MATYSVDKKGGDYELVPTVKKPKPQPTNISKPDIGLASRVAEGARPTVLGQGGPRDQFNTRLNALYQEASRMGGRSGGSGGSGGSGTWDPGRGSRFQQFENKSMDYAENLMDKESPYGQSATNLALRDTAQSLNARIQQIKDNFTRLGESGSLAEQKAIQQAQADAEMQKASTVQTMREAEAQYGLAQSAELRGWHGTFLESDTANRQLIMKGLQLSAADARASSNAAAAREGARMRMMLGIAQAQYDAGESAKRWDIGERGTTWQKEQYYGDQAERERLAQMAGQQQKKSNIFGLIGTGLGAVLGGPIGASIGAGIGGLFGGGKPKDDWESQAYGVYGQSG